MNLRSALANIHRDPHWWRSVLIGGALTATVVVYTWVAGFEIESLENTRKGFPTPLPRWSDWANRYVIGLLAVLIDIMFFVLPVFGFGLLRETRRPAARAIYRSARLRSLPAYLPAVLLFAACWLVAWPFVLALIWLALSALCYAHLVVVQLYVAADAQARWL
jgi:hypothetical protein